MATAQIPDVGKIVHFFLPDEDIPAPALITGVMADAAPESEVDLAIFWTDGIAFQINIPHRSRADGHSCWDWPSFRAPVEASRDQVLTEPPGFFLADTTQLV